MTNQITIYPQNELMEWLEETANREQRSLNNLILWILKQVMEKKKEVQKDDRQTTKKTSEQNNINTSC